MTDSPQSTSPVTETPDIIGVLRSVHSALDDALGDTDVSHIENDDELRDAHPVQWAAFWLAHAIEALEEAKLPAGFAQTPAGLIHPDVLMNVVQAKLNDYIELQSRGDLSEFGDHGWLVLVNLQRDMEFALQRSAVADTSTDRASKCRKCGCKLTPNEMIVCAICYATPDSSPVQPEADWNYTPKPGQLSGPSTKD